MSGWVIRDGVLLGSIVLLEVCGAHTPNRKNSGTPYWHKNSAIAYQLADNACNINDTDLGNRAGFGR